MNIIVLILVGLMGLASSVNAAGFRLAEQDAKANGMANSFVAVADNASAVWYNPAAITNMEGTNVSLGTVMVYPSMEHKNEVGATTTDEIENTLHIPPHFYVTRKLNENFSLGLGVNAPFGLSTEWDNTQTTGANTRFTATKSEVKAVNYNLNGAYKLNDKFSFAAGFNYGMVDATLNRRHPLDTSDITLEGDGTGMAFNTAVMYKHDDKWTFGANYRGQMKADLEGEMNVAGTKTDVETTLTLPDMLQFGAAYKYSDKWLFSAEADYTNWTTYRNIIIDNASTGALVSKDIKNWKSVWAFRLGTEYKHSDAWKFRAGTFYDSNPVPEKHFETRVPDTDRVAFAIGAGWNKDNITVDFSYLYLHFIERKVKDSFGGDNTSSSATDQKMNGKYNSVAHLPAITIGYKF